MPHCSAATRHTATFLFLALTVAGGTGLVPRLPAANARPIAHQRMPRPTLARPRAASLLHSIYLPLVTTMSSSLELIDAALKRGEITAEAALIYNVYAVFTDRRLPTKYQGDDSQLFDPGVLRQAAGQFTSLSPAAQATLQPFLTPPMYVGSWNDPARPMQGQASPIGERLRAPAGPLLAAVPSCNNGTLPGWNQIVTAHAIIWYQTAGDPIPGLGGSFATPAQTAAAANNLAVAVENIWTQETGLFQRAPLSDSAAPCNGGNGKFDIYVTRESLAARAQTVLYPPGGSYRPAYIWVAPDSASTPQSARDVLAHEFFHAISAAFKLARGPHEYDWLDEATANEMIDYVYPTDQYEQYYATSYMTLDHQVPIEASTYFGTNGYDDYVFLFFLARNYSPQLLEAIWNATEQADSLQAIEAGTQAQGGWATVWPVFAHLTWNDWNALVQDNYWQWDQLEKGVAQYTEPTPVSIKGSKPPGIASTTMGSPIISASTTPGSPSPTTPCARCTSTTRSTTSRTRTCRH